jgi:hypothetical protein
MMKVIPWTSMTSEVNKWYVHTFVILLLVLSFSTLGRYKS